jgi:hypothetical protein
MYVKFQRQLSRLNVHIQLSLYIQPAPQEMYPRAQRRYM